MADRSLQFLDDLDLERVQIDLLQRQLKRLLARSEFYRDKFQQVGPVIDIRSLADLAQLPFTYKEELRTSQETRSPFGLHACVSAEELVRVSSTSGTSGRPLYYAVTSEDKHVVWDSWRNVYDAAGIGPADRAIFAFAMGGPYGGLYGAEALEHAGVQCIPAGSHQSSARFVQLLHDLAPSVLTCITNFPNRLAQHLRETGSDPTKVGLRKLLLGGEPVSPVRSAIEQEWGADVYEMMGMGETGMIWGECAYRDGMHYLSKDSVLVEFIDPDTLDTVPLRPGASVELVYTHLRRRACPLIRYRTRDLVTVEAMNCDCGRQGPRIACVGRTDDMLKVRGVNVFPSAVAALLTTFGSPVTDNFRIRLREGKRKFSNPLSLIVGVETMPDSREGREHLRSRLAEHLRDNLNVRTEIELTPTADLGDALRGGLDRRDYFVEV